MLSCSEDNQDSETVFTVTFNSMGGTEIASIKVKEGMFIIKPDDPTLESNSFDGWFIDEEYSKQWDFEKDVVTKDITLYAKWTVTSSTDIQEEDLLGYWTMIKSHYREYNMNGELKIDEWDLTGDTGDFFNLKFEENGIYRDISPYNDGESAGLYVFNAKNKILILDVNEEYEHQSTFDVLELNEENLVIELKESIDNGYYYIDTRYFEREKGK